MAILLKNLLASLLLAFVMGMFVTTVHANEGGAGEFNFQQHLDSEEIENTNTSVEEENHDHSSHDHGSDEEIAKLKAQVRVLMEKLIELLTAQLAKQNAGQ